MQLQAQSIWLAIRAGILYLHFKPACLCWESTAEQAGLFKLIHLNVTLKSEGSKDLKECINDLPQAANKCHYRSLALLSGLIFVCKSDNNMSQHVYKIKNEREEWDYFKAALAVVGQAG